MKSTKRHFALEQNERLITPDSEESVNMEVYYKGKKITGKILALILYGDLKDGK